MIHQILFDFDGVIIDSMDVRDLGFRTIVKGHDKALIDEFIKYHRYNAGLSRYVKIRYFYEEMLGQSISDKEVNVLASQFSDIMKKHLITPDVVIRKTIDFIKKIYKRYPLHIVSGSDEKELNFLCRTLELDKYFVTIEGSPTHKNDLVSKIMEKYSYEPKETALIGDSINDYDAAKNSELIFMGINNEALKPISDLYVDVVDKRVLEFKNAH